jgi:hypothetical protein
LIAADRPTAGQDAGVAVVVGQQQQDGGDDADADGGQPGDAGELHEVPQALQRGRDGTRL